MPQNQFKRLARFAMLTAATIVVSPSYATVTYTGIAAGDATTTDAVVWTRALDDTFPANLKLFYTTDPLLLQNKVVSGLSTVANNDYTLKYQLTGLQPGTTYYYFFLGPRGEQSATGTFKTAYDASISAPVHFGFSGDMDGLMRPYALAATIPAQKFDFYVNLGDVIYENASNAGGINGTPGANNSPSVTLTGNIPAPSATGATQSQLFNDFSKKYREQFVPVNAGGQNGLQVLYAAQGNYTLYDNHELGNKQYINGGAPAGGPVGDMASGAGVDARVTDFDVNTTGTFINKSLGFLTLQQTYLNYQPIADLGTINAPLDPRSHGTKQLFHTKQWGKNVLFLNTDARSYRDIRIKTAANADEASAPRANNPKRTLLGATQLAAIEQALLNAQIAGTTWKFITTSDPIDQIGPIGGASLTLNNLPNFGTGVDGAGKASTYGAVSSDGGKSWIGGYRAERNALLKFIADNKITNVVFLTTDDHQNRINELTYSPTGDTENQSSYTKVPYTFEITAGPLGATGPDLITNHTFLMAQQLANSIATAQAAAGVEPIGLQGYPGLKNVTRIGDPTASFSPSAVDFYSPDTFNYNTLDVSANGDLSVASFGIYATAQNAGLEYDPINNPVQKVFSFQITPAPYTAPPASCLMNWAEKTYSNLFAPSGSATQVSGTYTYRYYKDTDTFVGISSVDNHVYSKKGSNGTLQDLGTLQSWLKTSGCAS